MFKVSEVKHSTPCLSCKGTIVPRELQVSFGKYFQHLSCISISRLLTRDMFWSSPELSPSALRCLNAFILAKNKELQRHTDVDKMETERRVSPKPGLPSPVPMEVTPPPPAVADSGLKIRLRVPLHINSRNIDSYAEYQHQYNCVQIMLAQEDSTPLDVDSPVSNSSTSLPSYDATPFGASYAPLQMDDSGSTSHFSAPSYITPSHSTCAPNEYLAPQNLVSMAPAVANSFGPPISAPHSEYTPQCPTTDNLLADQPLSLPQQSNPRFSSFRVSNTNASPSLAPEEEALPLPSTHTQAFPVFKAAKPPEWPRTDSSNLLKFLPNAPAHGVPPPLNSHVPSSSVSLPTASYNDASRGPIPTLPRNFPMASPTALPRRHPLPFEPVPLPTPVTQTRDTRPNFVTSHSLASANESPRASSHVSCQAPPLPNSTHSARPFSGTASSSSPLEVMNHSFIGQPAPAPPSVPSTTTLGPKNGQRLKYTCLKSANENGVAIQPTKSCLCTLTRPPPELTKIDVLSLLVEDDHVKMQHQPQYLEMPMSLSRSWSCPLPAGVLAVVFTYGSLSDLYNWSQVSREWAAAMRRQELWKVKCEVDLSEEFRHQVLPRISPHLPENSYRTLYRWSIPPMGIESAPCVCCGHPGGQKLVNMFVCLGCSKKPDFGVLTKRQVGMQCGINHQQLSMLLQGTEDRKGNAFVMKHIWNAFAGVLRDMLSVQLRRARLSDHWKYHKFFDHFVLKRSKVDHDKDTKRASELVLSFKRLLIEEAKNTLANQPSFFNAWLIACRNEDKPIRPKPPQQPVSAPESHRSLPAFPAHRTPLSAPKNNHPQQPPPTTHLHSHLPRNPIPLPNHQKGWCPDVIPQFNALPEQNHMNWNQQVPYPAPSSGY